jgi:antitoxin (DNA-binding transcriptional repressor) of toxin-antitoxin stability system
MDVPVTELRDHLSERLDRVRSGAEVIVTNHGIPVARLIWMTATTTLQRLTADGVLGEQRQALRPTAAERLRPRVRRPVSDIVSDQRE